MFNVYVKHNRLRVTTYVDGQLSLKSSAFMCGCCSRAYKHAHNLRRHECGKLVQFKCDFCDKAYPHKLELEHHYFASHTDVMEPFFP
ncbi:zinc finger protein 646-like [Cylas formicarius]|uniref:zinc finger protein 646-like n=1 Tax=Cylas formicarius TaxID=197179 RepID=UPI002958391F|nr:zinc finger protein 646-like [Cylas formicarius]